MSRAIHAEKDFVFQNREQIENHLLAKIEKNTAGKIGTELELFVTTPEGLPITFDQVELIFEHIAEDFPDAEVARENGRIVALHLPDVGDVCLEPGGQMELSSKPCENLQELEDSNIKLRAALDKAAAFFDLQVKGQGHMPSFMKAEDMPRSRFAAYYRYCRYEIGDNKAEDLIATMKSVCSLQVNMDPMGDDFHEIYRVLMLLDTARLLSQDSARLERLDQTYAKFFPEQHVPVFEALGVSSNEELVSLIVDRLLTLKVPFVPDGSPEGFKSSHFLVPECASPCPPTPTVKTLLVFKRLTAEILDNALSLQLTLPNLRRHGVLETRSADSVDSVDEVMALAKHYHDIAYDPTARRDLLEKLKDVDAERLRGVFVNRSCYTRENLMNVDIGGGIKIPDLIRITLGGAEQKLRSQPPSPPFGAG